MPTPVRNRKLQLTLWLRKRRDRRKLRDTLLLDRFWTFDCREDDLERLQTSMDGIVALVDENAGGVVAYLLPAHEESILSLLRNS